MLLISLLARLASVQYMKRESFQAIRMCRAMDDLERGGVYSGHEACLPPKQSITLPTPSSATKLHDKAPRN